LSQAYIKGFKTYLQLERSMSDNTIEAYLHDVSLLFAFLAQSGKDSLTAIGREDLQQFLQYVTELNLSANSQARVSATCCWRK
jgi:integrase/recombinase XerD